MEKIKLLSLFSGIGAFEKALERKNIPFELVNCCEIDKYASKSFSIIHNQPESKNLWDITKINVNKLPDFDLMTWGFPCTSISSIGKQGGIKKDETASGLYFYGIDILKVKKPKYSIIENVKALVGKKFKKDFEMIIKDLEEARYNNYWKVLNAKDFGIPQNRERVFIVSIRKDVDKKSFVFPNPTLMRSLPELVEDDASLPIVHNIYGGFGEEKERRFYEYSPTIRTAKGGHVPSIFLKRGSVFKLLLKNNGNYEEKNIQKTISCLDANYFKGIDNPMARTCLQINDKIRMLTPLECFRLKGFDDEDYEKVKNAGVSNTQMYKQCGNSIVVNVLEAIFETLFFPKVNSNFFENF